MKQNFEQDLEPNPERGFEDIAGMIKPFCLALSGFLASCATTHQAPPPLKVEKTQEPVKPKAALVLPTESQLPSLDPLNDSLDADRHKDNPAVQKWIAYYTNSGKEHFKEILKRGALYKKQIQSILQRFNLPTNLYYLALIESDFKVDARSPAQAAGIWQFMSPTAKNYGLRINQYIDERRDPWRSTVAAALYLRNLKNVFDSWYLAMSAYNAGEARIMNAIIRSGTRDFWQLSEIGFIPRETRAYVPRFLAALIVGEHPERYGIDVTLPEHPNVVSIPIPSPVRLTHIAEKTGLSVEELRAYNPHILKSYTPPKTKTYRIWLPQGRNNYEALASLETIPNSQLQHAHASSRHHSKKLAQRKRKHQLAKSSLAEEESRNTWKKPR